MKIIEYNNKYLEDIKDLLTELEDTKKKLNDLKKYLEKFWVNKNKVG